MKTSHNILIAGHRGYPSRLPENTLPSFNEAIRCGCDMLETDIRATKDGVLVLIHDASARRTAGDDRNIRDMTLAEVKALSVGDPALGYKIPTLEEFLIAYAPCGDLLFDLEIKNDADEGAENAEYLVDETVRLCRKYGVCERVMLNSFDFHVLKYCRDNYGKLFVTHGYYPYTKMRNVEGDPAPYLDYACFWATGEEAKACCDFLLSRKIKPCTGSRTPEEVFFALAAMGCRMFTENNPELTLAWRSRL